eukprot:scaffold4414_cov135-Isochrysis_galbana.AAC.2
MFGEQEQEQMTSDGTEKKIFSRNARHASGGSTGHLCPLPTGHSPSPFPFFSQPLLLTQAVYSGGVVSELRASTTRADELNCCSFSFSPALGAARRSPGVRPVRGVRVCGCAT